MLLPARIRRCFRRLQPVHFLHIGKTGGTAIREALKGVSTTDRYRLMMHSHPKTLRQIPSGESIVVFLRDPVTRCVSGFYSRLRQGKPRYHFPWTPAEETAFRRFRSANALATALSSDNDDEQRAAESAMNSIGHVRFRLADWFCNEAYLRSRFDDVFFIGFQETLCADFQHLMAKLGLDQNIRLPTDGVLAHRTPRDFDVNLTPQARANLEAWFADDYGFLQLCRNHAAAINGHHEFETNGSPFA